MRRRTFLTTALACSIAHAARSDDLEAAADLVGAQVTGGAVKGAVLDVRRDQDVFQRCYGSALTVDAIFLLA